MQNDSERLAELLTRMRQLSSGDRKAVLARMPLDQRYSVEQLLQRKRRIAATEPVEDEAPSAARKYAAFSPVLARMLGAIENGEQPRTADGRVITKAACQALADAASEIRAATQAHKGDSGSIWDGLSKLLFGERIR